MVVMTVLAAMLAVAAPPLTQFLAQAETRQFSRHLLEDIATARQYAQQRAREMRVCAANTDFSDCTTNPVGPWTRGWLVVDSDTRQVLRRRQLPEGALSVRFGPSSNLIGPLRLLSDGRFVDAFGADLAIEGVVCNARTGSGQKIQLHYGGRVHTDEDAWPC